MKEIRWNKGEKVQPQVCVAGLSQRKFSVNDLQVQENCSHEPISWLGAGSVTRAKVGVQVTTLRAIMVKVVFDLKNLKIITVASFYSQAWRSHKETITGEQILNPWSQESFALYKNTLRKIFLGENLTGLCKPYKPV